MVGGWVCRRRLSERAAAGLNGTACELVWRWNWLINVASDICDNSDMTLLRLVRRTGTVRFVGEGSVAYQLRATLLCYVPETLVTGHHCAVAVSVFLVDD